MKYIGKRIECITHSGTKRVGTIREIKFHEGLKKPIFECVSPYGNEFQLTKDEISKIL